MTITIKSKILYFNILIVLSLVFQARLYAFEDYTQDSLQCVIDILQYKIDSLQHRLDSIEGRKAEVIENEEVVAEVPGAAFVEADVASDVASEVVVEPTAAESDAAAASETEPTAAEPEPTAATTPEETAAAAADEGDLIDVLSLYEDFDSDKIHYPKTDFTKKTDTTVLKLFLSDSQLYTHPIEGRITSRFGERGIRWHYGSDIKLNTGDSVRTVFDGVLRITKYSKTYGYIAVVRHLNGLETYYAHLSKLLKKSGDVVKSGDVIGLGGNTGRSYGAHLHFEIRYLGSAINPEDIIDFENHTLKDTTILICAKTFEYMKLVDRMRYHKVRSGDTLWGIARKYGTSVSSIQRLNKMGKRTNIRMGSTIRIK